MVFSFITRCLEYQSSSALIPASTTPTSNASHNTCIIAAIVVPTVLSLAFIALGIGYCLRRHRRSKPTLLHSRSSSIVAGFDDTIITSRSSHPSPMDSRMVTPADSVQITGPGLPFIHVRSSPIQWFHAKGVLLDRNIYTDCGSCYSYLVEAAVHRDSFLSL